MARNIGILVHQSYLRLDGGLTKVSADRMDRALALLEQGEGDVLLLTAGVQDYATEGRFGIETAVEPTVQPRTYLKDNPLRRYALQNGVSPSKILTTTYGRDTVGETWGARALVQSSGLRGIIGVSSSYQASRCIAIHDMLFEASTALSFVSTDEALDRDTRSRTQLDIVEAAKLQKFRDHTASAHVIKGVERTIVPYLSSHPFYQNSANALSEIDVQIGSAPDIFNALKNRVRE